jgi:hypothetical protein
MTATCGAAGFRPPRAAVIVVLPRRKYLTFTHLTPTHLEGL